MIHDLDATDARILSVLQRQGRISNADLAEEVNLSASACHRRVHRLEQGGYIRDYVALLDPRKLGRATVVFVEVTLSGQADDVHDLKAWKVIDNAGMCWSATLWPVRPITF